MYSVHFSKNNNNDNAYLYCNFNKKIHTYNQVPQLLQKYPSEKEVSTPYWFLIFQKPKNMIQDSHRHCFFITSIIVTFIRSLISTVIRGICTGTGIRYKI